MLDIINTTDSVESASYLDLLLSIDADKKLHTKLYDKRDDFDFHIVNFPFLDSNILSAKLTITKVYLLVSSTYS